MNNNDSKGMSWMMILVHALIVCVLSGVAIYFISQEVCPSISDYISGVGSVASIYAILITLWQLRQVKKVAQAAKEAAERKSQDIVSFMTFADVERHLEMCKSIAGYISGGQFEAAAMKMDDIRYLLVEIRKRYEGKIDKRNINKVISEIGNDSVNLRRKWMSNEEIDFNVVLDHVKSVSDVLLGMSVFLKSEQL